MGNTITAPKKNYWERKILEVLSGYPSGTSIVEVCMDLGIETGDQEIEFFNQALESLNDDGDIYTAIGGYWVVSLDGTKENEGKVKYLESQLTEALDVIAKLSVAAQHFKPSKGDLIDGYNWYEQERRGRDMLRKNPKYWRGHTNI